MSSDSVTGVSFSYISEETQFEILRLLRVDRSSLVTHLRELATEHFDNFYRYRNAIELLLMFAMEDDRQAKIWVADLARRIREERRVSDDFVLQDIWDYVLYALARTDPDSLLSYCFIQSFAELMSEPNNLTRCFVRAMAFEIRMRIWFHYFKRNRPYERERFRYIDCQMTKVRKLISSVAHEFTSPESIRRTIEEKLLPQLRIFR